MDRCREPENVSQQSKKRKTHAPPTNITGLDRRWRPVVAGEQVHPNASNHQVDLECGRGHRRRAVALGYFWTFSQPLANSCRHVNEQR